MPNENNTQILRTPYKYDAPRAFIYTNSQQKLLFCGSFALTIWNYAQYYNYDLQLDYVKNLSIPQIYENLRTKQYNISFHGSIVRRKKTDVQYSYPVEWGQNCVMVPYESELPKYLYIVWPFGRYIWLMGIIGALYIAILMRYIEHPRRGVTHSFTRNLLYSAAILLYCANMHITLRKARTRVLIFYGLLLLLGFILNAYYMPYFTMYYMKPIYMPPIRTVEDLLRANIEILIPVDHLADLRANEYVNLTALEPIIRNVTRMQFLGLLDDLDRSYAYIISQDQWNFVHKQQRHLTRPYFRFSEICFGAVLKAYPLQLNSTFASSLNSFILAVKQAGLWFHWEEQAFNMAVIARCTKILLDSYHLAALKMDFFRLAWYVLAAGLSASSFTFIAEYIIPTR